MLMFNHKAIGIFISLAAGQMQPVHPLACRPYPSVGLWWKGLS